jgi:hypothetical protein
MEIIVFQVAKLQEFVPTGKIPKWDLPTLQLRKMEANLNSLTKEISIHQEFTY